MTIALGILATDGVVIAADRQLTVPGYLKMDHGKISMIARSSRLPDEPGATTLLVTGAGAEASVNHLQEGLNRSFSIGDSVMSTLQIRSELERQVLDFHDKHVTPHGKGELDVWMMVGVLNSQERKLWITNKSVVTEESFAAVGAGEMYARILMSRFYAPMTTLGALLLASYVICQVKKTVDGCGSETDLTGMSRGKPYWIDRSIVRQLEELFERYDVLMADVLHGMFCGHIGWPETKKRLPAAESRILKREFGKVLESIEAQFKQAG